MTTENPNDMLDRKLRDALAGLPRDIQPQRDLWPAIDARITPRHRLMRYWPAAAAIALAALVGAMVLALRFGHPAVNEPSVAVNVARPLNLDVMPHTPRAIAMAASVRRSTRLDPKTQAVLLNNLAIIENSLDNIQRALQQNPDNPGLQQLLYQMYRSEAALLDAAQRVQLQTTTGVAT
ncbi:MAG TPA: hypothetical protein VFW60_07295 [Rhodanobacteraceae bacterium]|nr:hypothetical protein [Rhodanobacteraceae bacterium]